MPPEAPAAAPAAPSAPATGTAALFTPPAQPSAPAAAPAQAANSEYDLSAIPEQVRPSVEPILKQTSEKYQKELTQVRESTKAFQEKATALDKLLAEPWFQKAWYEKTNPQAPQQQRAPEVPSVSPEEWQSAYDKALAGDMTAMNQLTEKQLETLVQQKYEPAMKQMATKQREIELNMEMSELFTNHPDAKEFDRAGLLEPTLHLYTDKRGRPMEHAYQEAKKTYDYIANKIRQEMTAQAQEKKNSVTETPSTTTVGTGEIVYVDTPQQALRQQLMATMKGLKVRYAVRPKGK